MIALSFFFRIFLLLSSWASFRTTHILDSILLPCLCILELKVEMRRQAEDTISRQSSIEFADAVVDDTFFATSGHKYGYDTEIVVL